MRPGQLPVMPFFVRNTSWRYDDPMTVPVGRFKTAMLPEGRAWRWQLILLALLPLIRAQQNAIPPPDKDPFVGEWRANATKSQPNLNKVEASYSRTVRREGGDLIFASSGGASKAVVRDFRIRCDGGFHPLPVGSVVSCLYVAPSRVEGETKDPNGEHSFWAREVSLDGSELRILQYKDKARIKLRSVWVLDRVR
jgi:hypothetical protein